MKAKVAAAIAATLVSAPAMAGQSITNAYYGSTLVTTGDPNDPMYAVGSANGYSGTGTVSTRILSGEFAGFTSFCSGTVIGSRYILTAAHCVDHQVPGQDPGNEYDTTRFRLGGSGFANSIESTKVYVHPYYLNPLIGRDAFGAFAVGDIAIIELPEGALQAKDPNVTIHGLYSGSDEFNKTATHIGYGTSGSGKSGGITFDLIGRTGLNEYEQTLAPFFGSALFSGSLLYDFDSGRLSNDAMSWWFGTGKCATSGVVCNYPQRDESLIDLGYGDLEGFIAGGDSGGASFIDGLLAGVHSFGFTSYCANAKAKVGAQGAAYNPDRDCDLNSTFGEMAGDTRVSLYYSWIMDILGGGDGSAFANVFGLPPEIFGAMVGDEALRLMSLLNARNYSTLVRVPEPGMLGLFGLGVVGAIAARRRRKA